MSYLVRSTVVVIVNETFSNSMGDVAGRNMAGIENTFKSRIRVPSSEAKLSPSL